MKFLCVPCDTPMRLRATAESEPGSLSVVYSCPDCGYEMAMLTNKHETDMVRSLGVRIGPAAAEALANPGPAEHGVAAAANGAPAPATGGKCPFSAMLGGALPAGSEVASGPAWTAAALARLEAIPEMVRPMAKAGIEMVAKERGTTLIDESMLAEARARFGM